MALDLYSSNSYYIAYQNVYISDSIMSTEDTDVDVRYTPAAEISVPLF